MLQPQTGFTNAGSAAVAGRAVAAGVNASTQGQTGQTLPNEGLYGEYQANALKAYQDAQASIAAKRSGIYQSYGFNPDGSVNGNNFTGQYQQMKHSQALELNAAENQAHERGLGGHGLGAQIAEAPRFQEDVDSANLGNSYLGALDSNSQDLAAAGGTYQQALVDARRAQIEDDIANGRYDTAADPGTSTVSTNAKKTAAKLAAASRDTSYNRKITANKTGASATKKRGVYAIH